MNFEASRSQVSELIAYIKKKETNEIKQIHKINLVGEDYYIVDIEKELIFFNISEMKIVKVMDIKYHKVVDKMIESNARKKMSECLTSMHS